MEADLAMVFMFAGNFAPRCFAFCDGQLLSITDQSFSVLSPYLSMFYIIVPEGILPGRN